jgi:Fic family protein
VKKRLQDLFERLARELRSLLQSPDAPDYEARAFDLAIRTHATAVEIQPFIDGNKRTCRLLLNIILLKLGLPPVPMEHLPRQDYAKTLSHFLTTGDVGPMVMVMAALVPG